MDNKVIYKKASLADCKKLAPILRKADKDELIALCGENVNFEEILTQSLNNSLLAFSGYCNNEIIGMFGVGGNVLSGNGFIWLLTSNKVKLHKRELLIQANSFIKYGLTIYKKLSNVIDVRNKANMLFLKHLNFKFGDKIKYNDCDFISFCRTRGK
ncbi:hypothetical protein AAEX28_04720 [Lentisphaerota bacterium WC36G]|nr:hypothetical protein LJT99_07580 [Lentisphaerae bacterium WC36]